MSYPSPFTASNGAETLLAGADAAHLAVVSRDARIRYGELRDAVARAAAVWRAHGLQPGGRVAVQLPDGIDWVVAWLGAIWAGGVAVGVDPRLPAAAWQALLEASAFDRIVTAAAAETPAAWRDRAVEMDALRSEMRLAAPATPRRIDADAPAFWVHSSGSSGPQKAVVHAHRALCDIGRVSSARLGLTGHDRLFAGSKLFSPYPLVNVLLAGLALGATVLLDAQGPSAAAVADSVAALRPTVLFGLPTLYRDLLRDGVAPRLHRAGVARCVSAGEALPPRLCEAWQRQSGLPLIDGYGTAETLVLVLTALPGDDGLRPSPGVRVQPLDPCAAATGAPTRLLVHTDTLARGYHERSAAAADAFRDGGFCPTDLFVLTQGGGWRFAGREDTLVRIGSHWVDLADLGERLGADLPGLHEGAAACVADADGSARLVFFYVADDEVAVQRRLTERIAALPPHQRPAGLQRLHEWPRTATGKLLRRQLVQTVQEVAA